MYPYPLERLIAEYKQKYSSLFTFSSIAKEGELIILARPLSLGEFEYIGNLSLRNEEAARELVLEKCLIATWSVPLNSLIELSELPIGIPLDLYNLVLAASNLGEAQPIINDINTYRNIGASLLMGGSAFIMSVFPQYKIADIKALTRQQFAELIVLAEVASKQPFNIKTPEELAKEAKKHSNSNHLSKIKEEAKINDRYINFAQENAALNDKL